MMAEHEWRLDDDDEVRLRFDAAEVYPYAFGGAKARIRGRRIDGEGFPMVSVAWDREDFRTEGQTDGWYYESHFDKRKVKGMDDETRKALGMMSEALQKLAGDEPAEPAPNLAPRLREPEEPRTPEDDVNARYLENLELGVDAARNAEAFALVILNSEKDSTGVTLFEPALVVGYKDEPSFVFLGSQLTRYGSALHGQIATNLASRLMVEENDQK